MSDEDTAKPLFAYAPVGPRFEIKDIANCIAGSGIPYPTAHARVKIYAKPAKGDGLTLIHVREAGRATQPNIYEFSDAGAALVLSATPGFPRPGSGREAGTAAAKRSIR